MDTQRLILFVVFSFSVLLLWDAWQRDQHPPVQPQAPSTQASAELKGEVPQPSGAFSAAPEARQSPSPVSATGSPVYVETDVIKATLNTVGGDVRRLELLKHKATQSDTANFVLLDDKPSSLYVAQSGLIGPGLPSHKATFHTAQTQYKLAPGANHLDVQFTWQEGDVQVVKTYRFTRGSYVIDVSEQIINRGSHPIAADGYFQLVRKAHAAGLESHLLPTFTGPAFYTESTKFHKVHFEDIAKGKGDIPGKTDNGWVAMLQHYFLSAWLPQGNTEREFYARNLGGDLFSAGVIVPIGSIGPGQAKTVTMPLYAGPQEQDKLSELAPGLDLTVDYGWLTVIAAPLFWVLSAIEKLVGNWGVAIILLTVLIKLAFYPLSAKSYRSMAQLRVLGPKLQRLKEQYGDDRQRMHQAMMDLYKTEKINPLGGCLPILVQIPVFIALYWVLLAAVELRHAPFYGWIQDLSAPDPYYILPIVMGITMIIQAKLNPTPPDPIQAKVMMILPVAFSVFFIFFPAGLVLYWLVNSVLSIAQQWHITHSLEKARAQHGKR